MEKQFQKAIDAALVEADAEVGMENILAFQAKLNNKEVEV